MSTPGPWFAHDASNLLTHDESGPLYRIGPDEYTSVAEVRPGSEDDDLPAQTEANARLIAAAPDLLEALEQCVEKLWTTDKETVEKARAAIAKARGKEGV